MKQLKISEDFNACNLCSPARKSQNTSFHLQNIFDLTLSFSLSTLLGNFDAVFAEIYIFSLSYIYVHKQHMFVCIL